MEKNERQVNKMKKITIISLVLIIGISVSAKAEGIDFKNRFSVSANGGYWFTSIKDTVDITKTIGSLMFGADLLYGFSKDMMVGGAYRYWTWSKTDNIIGTDIKKTYTAMPLMLSINYKLDVTQKEIVPFIDLGLGLNMMTVETSSIIGVNTLNEMTIVFGGGFGIETFVSPEFSICPEVGYLFSGYTDLNGIYVLASFRLLL